MDGCRAAVTDERVSNQTSGGLGEALVAQQRWLTRYVARRLSKGLRSAVAAEDVVQETFVAALRHGGEFRDGGGDGGGDGGAGALRRWLATLAHNRLCDLARHRGRLKRGGAAIDRQSDGDEPHPEAECPPDERLRGDEERAALAAAIGGLSGRYREVIRLRYACGLDVGEVAARLGRSPGAVAMLCHRAIQRLRREMATATG
jgi:RNA polymerase sigma-70 factor (ECF subfamily)